MGKAFTDNTSPKIVFEKGKCDISGMYFQDQEEDWDEETFGMKMPFEKATYNIWDIPLTKFEEYVKRSQTHGWMIVLVSCFQQEIIRKEREK